MQLREGAKTIAKRAVGVPVGYSRGLSYPWKGLRFVFFQHPKLARFWLPPIAITFVLLTLSFVLGWRWHDDIVGAMWAAPSGAGFWVGVLGVLHWMLRALVLLVLWAVGLIAVVLLASVVAAPFNDLLSEEVEHLARGTRGPPFSIAILLRDSLRTIGLELLKLALYLCVMVPTFVISYVPVVGPILYTVVGFLFTTLYFAIDYTDWPASRRNRSIHYRFGMLREHFLSMFGFGTGVWLFLFIPLVNLLFMPAAVAGGTLLYLDLERDDPERDDPEAEDLERDDREPEDLEPGQGEPSPE